MTEGARQVTFENVRVQIGVLAAADGGDEIGEMVAAAGPLPDLFAINVEGDRLWLHPVFRVQLVLERSV